MPVPQTSYVETMPVGYEGQLATMWGLHAQTETRICETAAGIGFGRAVSNGAAARGAILGGTAAKFLGVSIRDITLVTMVGQTVDVYPQRYNIGVMNSGDIWVIAVNGAVLEAVATFDGTTGQFNPAAAGLAIPGSRWITAASAGGIACLRLTRANP